MDEGTLFDSYHEEFKAYRTKVEKLVENVRNLKSGTSRRKIITQLEKKFSQIESVLNNMEHEAHSDKKMLKRHLLCEKEYVKVKNEFDKLNSRKSTNKEKLFFYDDNDEFEDDSKTRLLKTTETAENQQETIDRSLKALDNIDDRADNTMDRLVLQRGQIEKAIDNVHDIQAEGSQGARVINRIRRRQIINKLVFLCIILILILGILVVIYFGVINPVIQKMKPKEKKKKD